MKAKFFILMALALISTSCATHNQNTMMSGGDASYSEIAANGRIYVLGSAGMIEKYSDLETGHAPHLPYTQTYLGLGPNGETVVIENQKKKSDLKLRLLTQFCKVHSQTAGQCAI